MAGQRVSGMTISNSAMTRVVITGLVSSLAATLGGCSMTTHTAAQAEFNRIESRSSMRISPDSTAGRYDADFFAAQAATVGAPSEWVQEANAQNAILKLQRAEAEGARVKAAADRNSAIAEADEMLSEASTLHKIAGFEGDRQRAAQGIRFNQLQEEIHAQQTLSDITKRSGQIEIANVASDLKGQVAQMTAEADAAWAKAQVECDRIHAEHERVAQQGEAIIDQMNEQVSLLGERADHQATALEAQAKATRERARAEAQLLAQQSKSELSSGKDRQKELSDQAEFVVHQAQVEADRLNAEADKIDASNVEGTYRSSIAGAERAHEQAKARGNELRQTAMQKLNGFTAEFTSARQAADTKFASDSAAHQRALDALSAEERQASATYSIQMSRAQEIEFDGRGTFIQAQIAADRTGAPASEVRANAEQVADDLAAAFRDTASHDPATVDLLSETEWGDAFVAAVAKADAMRADAKHDFEVAKSDIAGRRTQAEMAFEDAHATFKNTKSRIDSSEAKATTEVNEMFAQADALLEQSERDYKQACTDAESVRDQALARAEQLRAKAEAVVASAEAKSAQLKSDSEGAFATAQAMAAEYDKKREAVLAAAEAQSRQYLAQADLVRSEKARRTADINQRIAASQSLLDAELARLETTAKQTYEVARLEHEEATLVANTYDRIGTARVQALAAQNALSAQDRGHALARAQQGIETEHELVNTRIDNGLAQADAALDAFHTEDSLRRARASALEQIMLAWVEQQHATAEAEEVTIGARFNTRLAQLQADRDRAYAAAYVDRQRLATANAVEGAPTPPELSDATLARLEAAATNIRQAASEAKNILQTAQAQAAAQENGDTVDMTGSTTQEVANVPTDND